MIHDIISLGDTSTHWLTKDGSPTRQLRGAGEHIDREYIEIPRFVTRFMVNSSNPYYRAMADEYKELPRGRKAGLTRRLNTLGKALGQPANFRVNTSKQMFVTNFLRNNFLPELRRVLEDAGI